MVTRGFASLVAASVDRATDMQDWREEATCAKWDLKQYGDPWFPSSNKPDAFDRARSLCNSCPVKFECQDWATSQTDLKHGFIGGLDPEQRQRARDQEKTRRYRAKKTREKEK